MSPEAASRLRSVRDCGVLRAGMGDEGLVELIQLGLVERRYIVGPNPLDKCDFLLTERGRVVAGTLPPAGIVEEGAGHGR